MAKYPGPSKVHTEEEKKSMIQNFYYHMKHTVQYGMILKEHAYSLMRLACELDLPYKNSLCNEMGKFLVNYQKIFKVGELVLLKDKTNYDNILQKSVGISTALELLLTLNPEDMDEALKTIERKVYKLQNDRYQLNLKIDGKLSK